MKGYQSGDVPTTAREGIVRLVGLVEWLQARQSDQAAPSVGADRKSSSWAAMAWIPCDPV